VSEPGPSERLVAPEFLWGYTCNQKGCCCRSWRVTLKEHDLHRLRIAAVDTPLEGTLTSALQTPKATPFAAFIPASGEQARFGDRAGRTVMREDGRCAFLDPEDLCDIHTHAGEEALPDICRNFPIQGLETPSGDETFWEIICPEVTVALARAPDVAELCGPGAGFERTVDVHRGSQPVDTVRLTAAQQVSFAEFAVFRQSATALLQEHAESPLQVLATIAVYVQRWCEYGTSAGPMRLLATSGAEYAQVILHLSRMVIESASERGWLKSRALSVSRFFEHHPWGTESTLDLVGKGELLDFREVPAQWHTPSPGVQRVLVNYVLMKVQALPLSNNGTMELGYRQLLETLGSALYFGACFCAGPGEASDAERFASALSLTEYVYRGRKEPPAPWPTLSGKVSTLAHPDATLRDLACGVERLTTDALLLGGFDSDAECVESAERVVAARFERALNRHARSVKSTITGLGKGTPCPPLGVREAPDDVTPGPASIAFHARCLQVSEGARLAALAQRLRLHVQALETISLLFLVETQTRWARVLAHVSLDYDHRAPTLRSLGLLLGEEAKRALRADGPLRRLGIVECVETKGSGQDEEGRRFRLSAAVIGWLLGNAPSSELIAPDVRVTSGPASALVSPPTAIIDALFGCLESSDEARLVNLVGPEGYDRVAVVRAVSQRDVSAIRLRTEEKQASTQHVARLWRAALEALLADNALLVLADEPAMALDDTAVTLARIASLSRGMVFVATRHHATRLFRQRMAMTLFEIPSCDATYRAQVLVRALPKGVMLDDAKGIKGAVRGLAIPPDLLVAAARAAAVQAALAAETSGGSRARVKVGTAGLLHAMREQLSSRIGDYADALSAVSDWEDLRLEPESKARINEVVRGYKHRTQVLDHWGFRDASSGGNGITMLFYGPPGTGKTMAAGILAAELGLEMFKVDLSRVVDKYIGETQKSLGRVFDEAERGEVLLLFDEADSLFSKRTQVKSSTDRYANLETNYLLQRMEAYDGLVVLTTNHEGHLDPAFRRRIKHQVHFPLPQVSVRAEIWRGLIPQRAPLLDELDFEELAERFEMSGGHIKNAVLHAAILAAMEDRGLTMRDFVEGGNREYRALGKVIRAWGDDR
jgi:hypothetical protein